MAGAPGGGVCPFSAGRLLGPPSLLTILAIAAGSRIGCVGIALGSDMASSLICVNGTLLPEIRGAVCGGVHCVAVMRL